MSNNRPSLVALLGLLAVAGYQNREKISELIATARASLPGQASASSEAGAGAGAHSPSAGDTSPSAGGGGLLSQIGQVFGGKEAGGNLSGGLSDVLDRFRSAGQSDVADSWVGTGPNKAVAANQMAQALGTDTLDELAAKTGMSKDEILARLTTSLPRAVDSFTPEGRVPNASEAERFR